MYILHSLLNFHIQDVLDSNSKEEETTFANIFLKIVLQFFTLCLHRSCENLNKNIMIDSMNAVSYDRDSQYLTVEIPTQILILSQALAILSRQTKFRVARRFEATGSDGTTCYNR